MNKIWLVLQREYKSTVLTKAFILGAFVLPVGIYGAMIAFITLVEPSAPKLEGTIALIDETGTSANRVVAPLLKAQYTKEFLEFQKQQLTQLTEESLKDAAARLGEQQGTAAGALMPGLMGGWLDRLKKQPIPEVRFADIPPENADLENLKDQIRNGELIAIIHIHKKALELPKLFADEPAGSAATEPESGDNQGEPQTGDPERGAEKAAAADAESGPPPAITMITEPTMHMDNRDRLRGSVTETVRTLRMLTNNIDPLTTRQAMAYPGISVKTVTETGEVASNEAATFIVPMAFMMLLWICTFTGGQFLLTTTIEEKSSRVMEVLLSATSSMQLMSGKILGQGAVAMTMLAIYAGLSLAGLSHFGVSHLVPIEKVLLLLPYFIMAFLIIACLMAAIGAAVSEMRDAQALMGPVMMLLMLPMVAMLPIIRGPNSTFSVVCSYIVPPASPFVMALRLGGNQPIPVWQIVTTMLLGAAIVWIGLWVTAKIFRIGVLMYGTPPNFMTLLRWIRQA